MTTLPIETQAALAITVGLMSWLIGALAWEMAQRPWHRWIGRAAIAGGVLELAAFANFAAGQVEFLQFVQRGDRAHDTGSEVIEFTTRGGHEFRFDRGAGQSTSGIGYSTTMLPAMGCVDGSRRETGCGCVVARTACDCDGKLYRGTQSASPAMASTSPRRRVCECEQCTCKPCLCGELQAAANR